MHLFSLDSLEGGDVFHATAAAGRAKSYAEKLNPRESRMRENKMKITKANIKQLVAESIRDIFNENVDSPELGTTKKI